MVPGVGARLRTVADCQILDKTEVAPHVIRIVLANKVVAHNSRPGQFVNVRVADSLDPLLRRPFSVHDVNPDQGTFSLLFDVIGQGTALLAQKEVDDKISIVGPLGSWFEPGDSPDDLHVLVAGGCGVAPMHFLADALCSQWDCGNVTVLVGAKSGSRLLCEHEFNEHGVGVGVSTDDGSYGYHGLVTELFQQHLNAIGPDNVVRVYSCGPMPMMRDIWRISQAANISSCQLSLETAMACGIGVCMGCVVKGCVSHDNACNEWNYKRVCTEGPVFDARELVW